MTVTAQYDMPLGIQGLLMVGTAGTTPTAILLDDTKFEITLENTIVEWNTRGQPLMTSGYASQKVSATFDVQKNNMNPQFQALQIACQTRIPIAIKSLDKTAGFGVDCDWSVKSYKETQDKEGQDVVAFELALNQIYRGITWVNSAEAAPSVPDGF